MIGQLRVSFTGGLVAVLLLGFSPVSAQETITDVALWTGGLVHFENERGLNYSVEYQVRLNENMTALSSHFLEFMGYRKTTENLVLNGGYRFTIRPDHVEHRLYFGGFLDLSHAPGGPVKYPDRFRPVLQVGYQHDFNAEFDDTLTSSDSIRWILTLAKPITEKVTPFLLGGVLTTWNDVYSFGIDKIRLGGGVVFRLTERSYLRCHYLWEDSRFRTPELHTNVFWVRYELSLGK